MTRISSQERKSIVEIYSRNKEKHENGAKEKHQGERTKEKRQNAGVHYRVVLKLTGPKP